MISKNQKTNDNIKLLAAQRQLYSEGKSYGFWKSVLIFTTSVVFVLIGVFYSFELDDWVSGLLGLGIGILIKYILDKKHKEKIELAARIQERFDTNVFNLNWHEVVAKAPPVNEDINEANHRYKNQGERKKWLDNGWYAVPKGGNEAYQILFCQRSNFVWEWRQRKWYSNWLMVVLILVFAVPLIYSFWLDLSLRVYTLTYLLPSFPFIWLIFDALAAHQKLYKKQQAEETIINERLADYKAKETPISNDYLRSVQDKIFQNRSETATIPNFIYNHLYPRFEQQMRTSAESYKIDKT